MKTRIIKRKGTLLSSVALLGTAMLLTACGGDGGDSPVDDGGANPGEAGAQALLYAYPDNGQTEVSTAAPVVLRFSSAVNLGDAGNAITLYEGDVETGTAIGFTPEPVSGEPNNVLLQPDEDLKPQQTYTVVIDDLRLRKGTAKDQTLTFTTRPLHEGPKSLVVKDDTFEVSRRMPDGSAMEPVMDFSTFRFQFTQPIDRSTANYGEDPASTGPGGGTIPADSVVLRDSSGAPVPATLLVDGAYMTVDPEPEYLNAGETYTLDITADLASTYGETFGARTYTLTPKDSSPGRKPAILVQKLTQGTTSRLTGKPVNEVPVNGTLLGENKNITQASAEVVRAELADVTTYTDVTPIRLPKGTVLKGSEINPILIGGEVPAGFGSGDVTMTVLSDASGYLVPNPYAGNNPNALRIVHLMMDVGIATSEARANGAFTQDLLHIELVGLAEVDPTAGVLNLDAVSVVEPNILGQEYGYGMLSFQLQSYKDQSNPPQIVADDTPPTLQSWSLEDLVGGQAKTGLVKPGDPIILNFDEPLAASSIAGKVHLLENGLEVDATVDVSGSAIVINPRSPLKFDHELNPISYELVVDGGLSDINGNVTASISKNFALPLVVDQIIGGIDPNNETEEMRIRPPVVTATYPGFPCVTDPQTRDLANDVAGICIGSVYEWSDPNNPAVATEASDSIPVMALPKSRPIIVNFSKNIDPNSVELGNTFTVYQIDSNGNPISTQINGILKVKPRQITFYPDEAWQEGTLYAYTLHSNGDMHDSSCDPANAICSDEQPALPLQTQILGELTIDAYPDADPGFARLSTDPVDERGGGKNMVIYFRGGAESNSVLQNLVNAPTSDTNANFFHDTNHDVQGEILFPSISYTVPREYAVEEKEPGEEPDPYADQTESPLNGVPIDLNGVKPIPNSAKVLSRNTAGSQETDSDGFPLGVNYGNIGCGVREAIPFDPDNPFAGNYFIPVNCPDKKFVYLTGALNAEVTDEYSEQRDAIKVKIWPSQIVTTSLTTYTNLFSSQFVYSYSGPQLLRIRYAPGPDGKRDQPVTAWIRETEEGPVLDATVDLYLDVPYLEQRFFAVDNRHNLHSYPLTMDLSGPLEFLDDGRMVVTQFNYNNIDIDLRGYGEKEGGINTKLDLRLPDRGTYIKYVTQPIK